MCDVIQMEEVEGHVESQLLHTSSVNCYVQCIWAGAGEQNMPGKVSCKAIAR